MENKNQSVDKHKIYKKAANKSFWSNIKNNKKLIYIFSGLAIFVIVVSVFLIPVPNGVDNSATRAEKATAQFSENQAYSFTTNKVEFDNFVLPKADMKIYQTDFSEQNLISKISSKISNIKVDSASSSNLTTLFNEDYKFNYDKSRKLLTFANSEKKSSLFDGYTEDNATTKLSDLLGFDKANYVKTFSNPVPNDGKYIGFTFRIEGINTELPDNQNTTLNVELSSSGKLISLYWAALQIDNGSPSSLTTLEEVKKNFKDLKKYYYISDDGSGQLDGAPGPAGAAIPLFDFSGDIKINGGTLIYFNQNSDSNYITPTYKLRVKFKQDNKEYNGFVYVIASKR